MILIFFVLPIASGAILPFLPNSLRRHENWLAVGVTTSLFGFALALLPQVASGGHIAFTFDWFPTVGANLSLLLDGYTLFFILLITGMGSLIFLYSCEYMTHNPQRLKFYAWMLIFTGAMSGLVIASNLVVLYLFWEMTTISSFFLIGLSDQEKESRWSAVQAVLVTTLGSLAMLSGFLLLYVELGSLELPAIWAGSEELRQSNLLIPIVALVLMGVVTKSALFPFHIWLPSAMVAPTPVSAYLHSATMVTAGVFLVARLTPAFLGVPEWEITLVTLGLATLIIGGILALRQHDLKALLAYSTVSQLGMMVAVYGLGTEAAAGAATFHLMSHAIFKGALFLVVGVIEQKTGTRDIRRLGALAKSMPGLAVVATVAALSSGGIPPFIGFVSKETLLSASLKPLDPAGWLIPVALVLGSIITLAYSLKYLVGPFFGGTKDPSLSHRKISWQLTFSPGVLAVVIVVLGVYPAIVAANLISPAVGAVVNNEVNLELSLWHGLTLTLLLSLAIIVSGLAAYPMVRRINHLMLPFGRNMCVRSYQFGIDLADKALPKAYWHLQNGDLRTYIAVIILFTLAVGTAGLIRAQNLPFSRLFNDVDFGVLDYALPAIMGMVALALLFRKGRLEAIFTLGMIGMLVAAVFSVYSAPDLAMTQILIELLMVGLFMLGLRHMLAMFSVSLRWPAKMAQILISAAFGGLITVLLLSVLITPQHQSISPFFIENTRTVAKAKNVVNTILVDFRGYDTLGEITVIALAALATFAMVRARRERD